MSTDQQTIVALVDAIERQRTRRLAEAEASEQPKQWRRRIRRATKQGKLPFGKPAA